jgi:WD40 repeat protein
LLFTMVCAVWIPAVEPKPTSPVTALAFNPDGTALLSGGSRGIEVRSPEDGRVRGRIDLAFPKISSIAFDSGGRRLAVGGGTPGVGGEVQVWEWPGQRKMFTLTNDVDIVTGVAFDRDGGSLGVAYADHSARVWRLAKDGQSTTGMMELAGHAGPVLAIGFSPSDQSIVTASADRSVKVWASDDGRLLRTFTHHTEAVHALVFRPGWSAGGGPVTCATAGDDRSIRIWQPEIGRMVRIVRQHQGPVLALAYSADGTRLFSAGTEGIVRCFDSSSDTLLATRTVNTDWIYTLALAPDGSRLACGLWSGDVFLLGVADLVK